MLQKNQYVFDKTKVELPEIYIKKLNEVVEQAIKIFKNNLKSIILGGSGGKAEIIPYWSDLDIYIVLDEYNFSQVQTFMKVDNKYDEIHVGVTIYTMDEVVNNLIDGKTKVMIYEKEQLNVDPTLYGKNYFLKQKYTDIQLNDINNLPSIVHSCRRNCIDLENNEVTLLKSHVKKFIVMLKCILNINGIFSYGYQKVMNDFYNLCEEKKLLNKRILNFKIKEVTSKNYNLSEAKEEFLNINKFVFENLLELINKKINKSEQVISCMGVVSCKKSNDIYVALLRDVNNCWVIPKGHLEKNETFIEAAIREVKEETNVDITTHDFVDKVGEYKYCSNLEGTMKLIKIYLFKVDEFQPIVPSVKENFVDGKWLLLREAIEKSTYQEQKSALEKIELML